MSRSILYTSEITKVRFEISGTEDIIDDSNVSITSSDLFRNGQPHMNGVYDGHLGTTDHTYNCKTCYNGKKDCIGHEGHLQLKYPVQSPVALTEIRKWLKLICFNCGNPTIDESVYMNFPRSKRLDEASKIARNTVKKCVYCGTIHPTITRDKTDLFSLFEEIYEDKKIVERRKLYAHHIGEIFSRITDETVVKLGKYPVSHPRKFILYAIRIPPTTIRPDIKKMSGGRSTNDDLTTLIQYMVKKNSQIPEVFEEPIGKDLDKTIYDLQAAYYEFVRGGGAGKRIISGSSQTFNSLAARIKGKQGQIRKTILGKRIRQCGRSTITGDPIIKINEIGIPLKFARILQVEETVQEYNKQWLMTFFNNGRERYPGCTRVVKANTGRERSIESIKDDFELEIGDKLYRDLINGDFITFNRQPSLKPSNIGAHKVIVTEDPLILTLRMNVIACPLNCHMAATGGC